MSFLKSLSRIFSTRADADPSYWFDVKCNRCGEVIRGRVDMRNDLSPNYDEGDSASSFFCRKVLMGDHGCFQKIEVELTFSRDRKLISRDIQGGKFVEAP